MFATEAVWRLAKRVAKWIEGELRESGTYRPCPVNLAPGTVWYYVDRANTGALPFVFGALVLMPLGPFAILITTQAKRNLSSRSGIGGVLSAT